MNQVMEVYSYFKLVHKSNLILFKIGSGHRAYYEDARKISECLGLEYDTITDSVLIAEDVSIFDIISDLYQHGFTCKIVAYRGPDNEFALPDSNVINDEKEDY